MERKEVIKNIEFGFWDNSGGMKTSELHCELIKLLFVDNKELARLEDFERSKVVRSITKTIATNKNIIDSVAVFTKDVNEFINKFKRLFLLESTLGAVITGGIIGIVNIIYDAIRRKILKKKTDEKLQEFFERLKDKLK